MALLRFIDPASGITSQNLDSGEFVIGRADSCQLTFNDDMMSREHARIDLEREGRFRIRDLGSRNKTYVNGELITETLLNSGDIIRVGDHVLEFLDDTGSPAKSDLEFLTPDRTEPPNCDWIKTKAPLSLTVDQVEKLAQLFEDLPITARAEDVANLALAQVILEMRAERGFVALRGEGKTDLIMLAQRALRRPPGGSLTPVSQSFVLAPLLQSVAGRYPTTAGKIDPKLGYASTAVAAPLTHRGDIIGVLYIDRPVSKQAFPTAALPYCAAAGMQLGAQLASTQRRVARHAVREGAAWMTTIRKVQAALAGEAGSTDAFDVAMRLVGGRARCGDFAEVIHVDSQQCMIAIVDGGGHGITGIVQAQALCAAVRTAVALDGDLVTDPARLLAPINTLIASRRARQVIPCTFVGIDMSAGKLIYVNAGGMSPLLLVAPGRLVTLDQNSLIPGVDPDYVYDATKVDLPERFRLVCHTDGLTQAVSAAGEPMGDQRLHELLLSGDAFVSAEETVTMIADSWQSHLSGVHPDDDASVLVLAHG